MNKTLTLIDKNNKNGEIGHLLNNLVQITDDVRVVSKRLRTEDTAKTIDLLHKLIWRLEEMDAKTIKKFLQEDGIRAKIF